MRPGTMRSTSVEQKVQSPFTQRAKPSSSPHCFMYWFTQRSSSLPLLSMSSQESTTTPGLPALQRCSRTCVNFAGKEAGGQSSRRHEGSYTMPASVVLETMYSSASPAATSIMAS